MLKILAYLGLAIGVAVVGVLLYSATKPDTFRVQRTASIKAPPEKLFALINDLRGFNTWNPFLRQDPETKLDYGPVTSGQGAVYTWIGANGKAGIGRIEITGSTPPSKVVMALDFTKPMVAHNIVEFTLQPTSAGTEVTWAIHGPSPFISKVMDTLMNMDKMIGTQFEDGLTALKAKAE